MKQRIGLGLTLLNSPKLLILDEPTNGLDPAGIKHLRDILKEVAQKEKTAVFVSSHILSEMELMCDKVAVIDKGKIMKVEEIGKENEDNIEEETLIEVKEVEKAKELLIKNNYEVKLENDKIVIKTKHENIPEIIKLLAKNDVSVFNTVQKKKSLEDMFFDVTEGGKKNENA